MSWKTRVTRFSRVTKATIFVCMVALPLIGGSSAKAFTLLPGNPKWPNAQACYIVDAGTMSSTEANLVSTALQNWNGAGGTSWLFFFGSSCGNHIKKAALSSSDCSNGVLARTSQSYSGSTMLGYTVTINNNCGTAWYEGQFSYIPSNYMDFTSVARHELGHGIGLCHSGVNGRLMYRLLSTGTAYGIDTDARNALAYLYGSTSANPEGSCYP